MERGGSGTTGGCLAHSVATGHRGRGGSRGGPHRLLYRQGLVTVVGDQGHQMFAASHASHATAFAGVAVPSQSTIGADGRATDPLVPWCTTSSPGIPATPCGPCEPVAPAGPGGPCGPGTVEAGPVGPGGPCGPVGPGGPGTPAPMDRVTGCGAVTVADPFVFGDTATVGAEGLVTSTTTGSGSVTLTG